MVIGEHSAAMTTRSKSIYRNTQSVKGAKILNLSNYHMCLFHCNAMDLNFDCTLFYSNTDSLLYAIKSEDFNTEFSQKPQSVFGHYPPHHVLYNNKNKRALLKY